MRIALIGYGNVGRALARLLERKRRAHRFRITGIHTARHGTAIAREGLGAAPRFGTAAPSIKAFLDAASADVAVELTTLNPVDGEPAIAHIRAAFARGMHVVTANKGPLAHCFAELREEAARRGLLFRFESTVMDGAPVFNMARHCLPAARVLGFAGVLNSTSSVVVETMERGGAMEEGIEAARRMGITEGDGRFDIEGWDSASKAAVLANVLMDARTRPQAVAREGIAHLTTERAMALAQAGKTVRLVSRARRRGGEIRIEVRPEVLDRRDLLGAVKGTTHLLLLHTDLMGTVGTVSVEPGVEQTAYGVFADLLEIAAAAGQSC